MEIIFFTIFLTTLVIATITLSPFIKNKSFGKKGGPLIILSTAYLVFSITLFLWVTKILEFKPQDLTALFSIVLIIQTTSLLLIQSRLKQNKKLLYPLSFFALLIPSLIYNPFLIHLAIPISLLILLLTFTSTVSLHEKSTRYLIPYTSVSLFLYLFSILWQNLFQLMTLASSCLFLLFIINFIKFIKTNSKRTFLKKYPIESPLISFLKHFVFIIIMTNFIFIGTVSIHEFGHLAVSSSSNCEGTKIVYELKGLPHTEVDCKDSSEKNKWIIGGVLLPFLIAAFLFFSGGKFIRELSFQIIGFNMIISYLDLILLNISEALAKVCLVSGIIISILSLAFLVKTRIE